MSWESDEWRWAVSDMTELERAHDTHRQALGITGDKDDDQ